jgi:hypothetical protein
VLPILLLLAAAGCGRGNAKRTRSAEPEANVDPVQLDANLLGRELFDVVDRVMDYKTSHGNQLPASLRQVGIDTLTPMFIRRLGRLDNDPLITVSFRKPVGRRLTDCQGTNRVLEDAVVNGGSFEVTCGVATGGSRTFNVRKELPQPPAKGGN